MGLWCNAWGYPPSRHLKCVEVSIRLLKEMFTTGYRAPHFQIQAGIPADAVVVQSTVDALRDVLVLLVEHPSFPETVDGDVIDSLYIATTKSTFIDCPWDKEVLEKRA